MLSISRVSRSVPCAAVWFRQSVSANVTIVSLVFVLVSRSVCAALGVSDVHIDGIISFFVWGVSIRFFYSQRNKWNPKCDVRDSINRDGFN